MAENVCKSDCMCSQKVTEMVLKVNLQCSVCYMKVKKALSIFPQIKEQVYDEKNNKVIIKVVSCNPEKLRDKLYCKADGAIKCIEIQKPPPPPPPSPPPPCKKCCKGRCGESCHPPSCRKCSECHGGGSCYHPFPKVCCRECYEGGRGGPCYHLGSGQMRCYDGYCGSLADGSWYGGSRSWSKDYIYEETPSAACTIM